MRLSGGWTPAQFVASCIVEEGAEVHHGVLGANGCHGNGLAATDGASHGRAHKLLAARRCWRDLSADNRWIANQFMAGVGLTHPTNVVRHAVNLIGRADRSKPVASTARQLCALWERLPRTWDQPKRLGTNLGPHVLRAPERPARLRSIRGPGITRIPGVSRHNVLDPFPGGQVVAGSNPVSPTAVQRRFWSDPRPRTPDTTQKLVCVNTSTVCGGRGGERHRGSRDQRQPRSSPGKSTCMNFTNYCAVESGSRSSFTRKRQLRRISRRKRRRPCQES